MDPLSIAALVGAGVTALGTRWFVRRFVDIGTPRRQLRLARPVAIESVRKDGVRVRVDGEARPVGAPLAAPVGGEACIAYHLRVTRMVDGNAFPVLEDVDHVPFTLDDGTGRARIAGPIRWATPPAIVLSDEARAPAMAATLDDLGLALEPTATVAIEQIVLPVGGRGAALGRSQRVLDPSRAGANYRGAAEELRLVDLAGGPPIVGLAP